MGHRRRHLGLTRAEYRNRAARLQRPLPIETQREIAAARESERDLSPVYYDPTVAVGGSAYHAGKLCRKVEQSQKRARRVLIELLFEEFDKNMKAMRKKTKVKGNQFRNFNRRKAA